MIDPVTAHRWSFRALYLGVAALLLFLRLLPLSTAPGGIPGPDLLLCLTFAWVLRRPDCVPPLALAGVFLLEDLLTMRPPGLWTLLVLLAAEFLRDRRPMMRSLPFLAEWSFVAAVTAAVVLSNRVLLAITMVPQPGLGLTLLQLVMTLAAYPLVVAGSRYLFGVQPAELDRAGGRT